MDNQAQAEASHRVEEWAQAIPEAVRLLREGQSNHYAYALLYQLRWELGQIMKSMPFPAGPPTKEHRDKAQDAFDSQRWNAR